MSRSDYFLHPFVRSSQDIVDTLLVGTRTDQKPPPYVDRDCSMLVEEERMWLLLPIVPGRSRGSSSLAG